MNATPTNDAVERLVQFFEELQPQDLPRLAQMYAQDARFKDPFNEVQGLPAIERIFAHMFEALDSPHFIVTERIVQNNRCFLVWDFRFRFKRFDTATWQTVRGGTHLVFNDAGLVTLHRDYWDAAEELYEKLPLVGGLMRWLKRRANS
ncbi:nuclear transport factor 2 family protein [Limnohabitans sp.]|uniref:nuclear transport factor 2 family protein n=1 Tax=Limnohabitans sp. TaxID=1907725 RepID=UPI00311E0698